MANSKLILILTSHHLAALPFAALANHSEIDCVVTLPQLSLIRLFHKVQQQQKQKLVRINQNMLTMLHTQTDMF